MLGKEMVAHQAVGVYYPIVAITDMAKHIKEKTAIRFFKINVLSPVTTGGNMVQGTSEFDSKGSAHATSLAQYSNRKKERPDPYAVTPIP